MKNKNMCCLCGGNADLVEIRYDVYCKACVEKTKNYLKEGYCVCIGNKPPTLEEELFERYISKCKEEARERRREEIEGLNLVIVDEIIPKSDYENYDCGICHKIFNNIDDNEVLRGENPEGVVCLFCVECIEKHPEVYAYLDEDDDEFYETLLYLEDREIQQNKNEK